MDEDDAHDSLRRAAEGIPEPWPRWRPPSAHASTRVRAGMPGRERLVVVFHRGERVHFGLVPPVAAKATLYVR